MFIASKYEEMYSPDISDFVYITDNAYTKAEILQMEMLIIKTLEFSFGRPLPLHFLRRYSKAGKVSLLSKKKLNIIQIMWVRYNVFLCLLRHCQSITHWQNTS
jgi:hypothetical protein